MVKDRMAVLTALMDQGVIPVFYHPDVEVCKNVIQACADGGAPCIEFTNRGDFASHVFYEVTRHFDKADPRVIMGVGSIVDAPTAGIYIANGAKFVVGPILNADVAKVCNRRKIPYSPGCGSASEISYAEELGCEIVKVFPGPPTDEPGNTLTAGRGVLPWLPRPGVRRPRLRGLLLVGDADQRDRGPQYRQSSRLADRQSQDRGSAGHPVGVQLVAGALHAAGLVRLRFGR